MDQELRNCATNGCPNFCHEPNIYCGHCAGYAHEMSAKERRVELRAIPSAYTWERHD